MRSGSPRDDRQGGERLLARVDPEAGELLAEAFREEGIAVGRPRGRSASKAGDESRARGRVGATPRRRRSARRRAGTEPVEGGLRLEQLGVSLETSRDRVDEVPEGAEGVWAIGDVNGIAQFTHVGKYQARVAAADTLAARGRPPTTGPSRPRSSPTRRSRRSAGRARRLVCLQWGSAASRHLRATEAARLRQGRRRPEGAQASAPSPWCSAKS